MTVKELIEELKTMNPDAVIIVECCQSASDSGHGVVRVVEKDYPQVWLEIDN